MNLSPQIDWFGFFCVEPQAQSLRMEPSSDVTDREMGPSEVFAKIEDFGASDAVQTDVRCEELTRGHLRHSRFMGRLPDAEARKVVRKS